MVRGAVLALVAVALAAAACSSGKPGTVTLASPNASQASAQSTIAATAGRTPAVRAGPTLRPFDTAAAPAAASPPATGAWFTSSAGNAKYYYCDADHVEIAAKNRRAYPSEQALLAEWSGKRTKWPQSKC